MTVDYKETHINEPHSSFEAGRLLGANGAQISHQSSGNQLLHLRILYSVIAVLLVVIVTLSAFAVKALSNNLQLALWSPVNDIVGYKTVTFDAFFLGHESPWTRGPKEVKDELWDETYQFGISWITKKEASYMLNETLPAPHDSDKYMIQS
ncbi:hypothetical protein N7520_002902 [Penicillium odoratum]|uniref:uncharacterized protein n=1 Tax=Penicillium odoratum TaxID=1167516 RepID=UPI002547FE73|nr:uncharacterized protein N7520_002902 [Penicillium odoratum]KAJ5772373.1 hypothetical protein N7520_002902 [Penicillium odoratum]